MTDEQQRQDAALAAWLRGSSPSSAAPDRGPRLADAQRGSRLSSWPAATHSTRGQEVRASPRRPNPRRPAPGTIADLLVAHGVEDWRSARDAAKNWGALFCDRNDVLAWLTLGVSPYGTHTVGRWLEIFGTRAAVEPYLRLGLTPTTAGGWRDNGFGVDDIRGWLEAGLEAHHLQHAIGLRARGFTPAIAAQRVRGETAVERLRDGLLSLVARQRDGTTLR